MEIHSKTVKVSSGFVFTFEVSKNLKSLKKPERRSRSLLSRYSKRHPLQSENYCDEEEILLHPVASQSR